MRIGETNLDLVGGWIIIKIIDLVFRGRLRLIHVFNGVEGRGEAKKLGGKRGSLLLCGTCTRQARENKAPLLF